MPVIAAPGVGARAGPSGGAGPEALRVLLISEDSAARADLALGLEDQLGDPLVIQDSATDALAAVEAVHPDAVVWDLGPSPAESLPSLEALADLEDAQVPIVVMAPEHAGGLDAAAVAGVAGVVRRDVDAATLFAAVRAVVRGLRVADPALTPAAAQAENGGSLPAVEHLTVRESEVLQLLAEGLSNKAIAGRLRISEHTAKFHVNTILGKLGAQNRTEAATRAARLGLIVL